MFGNRNFKLMTRFVFTNSNALLAGKLLEKSIVVNLWAVEQVFRSSFHSFLSKRICIGAIQTDKVVKVAKKCAVERNNSGTWICGVNSRLDVINSGTCAFSSVVSARRIGEISEPAKSFSDPLEHLDIVPLWKSHYSIVDDLLNSVKGGGKLDVLWLGQSAKYWWKLTRVSERELGNLNFSASERARARWLQIFGERARWLAWSRSRADLGSRAK